MSSKETQKSKGGPGYGTDNPKDSTNLKVGGKTPALGSVGVVPDRSSPEQVKGGRN